MPGGPHKKILEDIGGEHSGPRWAALYDPSRKTLRALPAFVKENINVAEQLADWVTPGEVKDPGEIPPGTGAIVRRGLTKVAAYRDENDKLRERSAVCPHLGWIVDWNSLEKTWIARATAPDSTPTAV